MAIQMTCECGCKEEAAVVIRTSFGGVPEFRGYALAHIPMAAQRLLAIWNDMVVSASREASIRSVDTMVTRKKGRPGNAGHRNRRKRVQPPKARRTRS